VTVGRSAEAGDGLVIRIKLRAKACVSHPNGELGTPTPVRIAGPAAAEIDDAQRWSLTLLAVQEQMHMVAQGQER
jgi:hypothetical protein